jgi:antitoxin VapB
MVQASVFRSNRSQAVRLPKEMALPDDVSRVEVFRLGQGRVIVPAEHAWDDFFDDAGVSPDFMAERAQPAAQDRGTF